MGDVTPVSERVIIAGQPKYYRRQENAMQKYVCDVCGYIYDPEEGDPDNGVDPGTSFADLPEDWVCPMCGAGKEDFSSEE